MVVSGAGGGGIGTAVTRQVAEAGATVIAVSRSQDNLDAHVAPLARRGLPVMPVAADAATDDGIATVLDAARRADGFLYGLVNVAGSRTVDVDARDPRLAVGLARVVHREPRNHVLHEPGDRRRDPQPRNPA